MRGFLQWPNQAGGLARFSQNLKNYILFRRIQRLSWLISYFDNILALSGVKKKSLEMIYPQNFEIKKRIWKVKCENRWGWKGPSFHISYCVRICTVLLMVQKLVPFSPSLFYFSFTANWKCTIFRKLESTSIWKRSKTCSNPNFNTGKMMSIDEKAAMKICTKMGRLYSSEFEF